MNSLENVKRLDLGSSDPTTGSFNYSTVAANVVSLFFKKNKKNKLRYHVFRQVFNLPHATVILHSGNKVIRWPVFNATLTSVSSISASRACNVFPSEEITAVLNVYWLIVSTCTHPWSRWEGILL